MAFQFHWDPGKARQNTSKHGVSFEEATTVFEDPLSLAISDPLHSVDEERFIIVGESVQGRLLVVVHTDLGDSIRIITARVATRRERITYETGN